MNVIPVIMDIDGSGIISTKEQSDILKSCHIIHEYVFLHDAFYLADEDIYDVLELEVLSVKKDFYVYTEQDFSSQTMKLKNEAEEG